MLTTRNQEENCIAIIDDMKEEQISKRAREAYEVADSAAKLYFALPGEKSAQYFLATIGTALTNYQKDFPAEMKEVILQQTLEKYKSKINDF